MRNLFKGKKGKEKGKVEKPVVRDAIQNELLKKKPSDIKEHEDEIKVDNEDEDTPEKDTEIDTEKDTEKEDEKKDTDLNIHNQITSDFKEEKEKEEKKEVEKQETEKPKVPEAEIKVKPITAKFMQGDTEITPDEFYDDNEDETESTALSNEEREELEMLRRQEKERLVRLRQQQYQQPMQQQQQNLAVPIAPQQDKDNTVEVMNEVYGGKGGKQKEKTLTMQEVKDFWDAEQYKTQQMMMEMLNKRAIDTFGKIQQQQGGQMGYSQPMKKVQANEGFENVGMTPSQRGIYVTKTHKPSRDEMISKQIDNMTEMLRYATDPMVQQQLTTQLMKLVDALCEPPQPQMGGFGGLIAEGEGVDNQNIMMKIANALEDEIINAKVKLYKDVIEGKPQGQQVNPFNPVDNQEAYWQWEQYQEEKMRNAELLAYAREAIPKVTQGFQELTKQSAERKQQQQQQEMVRQQQLARNRGAFGQVQQMNMPQPQFQQPVRQQQQVETLVTCSHCGNTAPEYLNSNGQIIRTQFCPFCNNDFFATGEEEEVEDDYDEDNEFEQPQQPVQSQQQRPPPVEVLPPYTQNVDLEVPNMEDGNILVEDGMEFEQPQQPVQPQPQQPVQNMQLQTQTQLTPQEEQQIRGLEKLATKINETEMMVSGEKNIPHAIKKKADNFGMVVWAEAKRDNLSRIMLTYLTMIQPKTITNSLNNIFKYSYLGMNVNEIYNSLTSQTAQLFIPYMLKTISDLAKPLSREELEMAKVQWQRIGLEV